MDAISERPRGNKTRTRRRSRNLYRSIPFVRETINQLSNLITSIKNKIEFKGRNEILTKRD